MKLSIALAATIVGAAAGAGLFVVTAHSGSRNAATRSVAEHSVAIPAAVRTVVVSKRMPLPSPSSHLLSARIEVGARPTHPTTGEVLTDTNCKPDAQMVSHCRNEVRLADGTIIVLRHPHDMRRVRCMAPGEQVRIVPARV